MALTLPPYATGFPSVSLNTEPVQTSGSLHSTNIMGRAPSNMDNLSAREQTDRGDQQQQQYVDQSLDIGGIVPNFADPSIMGFGSDQRVELNQVQAMVDPELQPPSTAHSHHSVHGMSDVVFQTETGLEGGSDEDDESPGSPSTARATTPKRRRETQDVPGGFTYVDKEGESGRRKIRIEYITDKSRRHITFSKRKAGIMKKAYELSILTGTQVLLLVVSETGLVYTFTTTKLQPLVSKAEGKNLIQACLNAPDGVGPDGTPINTTPASNRIKSGPLSIRPHKLTPEVTRAMYSTQAQVAGATPDEAEAQAAAQAHAAAQAKAAASLGNGSPSAGRPKKRLPSKRRTASTPSLHAAAGGSGDLGQAKPDIIPPLPPMPDLHRQPSPSSSHMLAGPSTPSTLQSPLTTAYHIHPEYQHPPPQHPGMGSPSYGYPPPATAADYGVPHPGIPAGYAYPPQGHPQQHPNFLVPPNMYHQNPHQQPGPSHQPQPGPSQDSRRMMPPGDPQNPNMRMGGM